MSAASGAVDLGWSIEAIMQATSVCIALHPSCNGMSRSAATGLLIAVGVTVAIEGEAAAVVPPCGLGDLGITRPPASVRWFTHGPLLIAEVAEVGRVGFAGNRDLFSILLASALRGLYSGATPPVIGMGGGRYEASPVGLGGDA